MLFALLLPGCGGGQGQGAAAWPAGSDAYAFDQPDAVFDLPERLREVSGLTLLDADHLAAVQDEDGDFFVIDARSGRVVREQRFGQPGDYESIERVGDTLFVLRSDGDLVEVTGWEGGAEPGAERRETRLKARCDAEGLAYQPARRRLLVACKEHAGKDLRGFKAIYAYDLGRRRVGAEPVYRIDLEAFSRSLRDNPVNQGLRSALAPFVDLSGFKPSGLAVHPRTGQVYVLSSVRKAIVVLDDGGSGGGTGGGSDGGGSVAAVWVLPEALLRQPEGIAFLPNGDLFVASEGGPHGRLMRFNYKP